MYEEVKEEVKIFVSEAGRFIKPSQVKVVLDVGSRDAKVAINFSHYFPNAKIYAFECNPQGIELCRKNIKGINRVTLVEKAVADINGKLDFFAIDPKKTLTPHKDGNIGASSLLIANPDYPFEKYVQKKIKVESITLKKWAKDNNINQIDVMWMDLQGAELKALKGLGEIINKTKVIYTEVEYKEMYIGQPLSKEVDGYLLAKGFRFNKIFNQSDWFGNVMYVNKNLKTRLTIKPLIVKANNQLKKCYKYLLKLLKKIRENILTEN